MSKKRKIQLTEKLIAKNSEFCQVFDENHHPEILVFTIELEIWETFTKRYLSNMDLLRIV